MARGRRISRIKLMPPSPEQREKYLLEWSAKMLREDILNLPKLASKSLFNKRGSPLFVEIGPGSGEYLCALAEDNPNQHFLGIEASKKGAYFAVYLAAKKSLNNLKIIKANFLLLNELFEPNTWQQLYLHFPDPVHKREDEKRRIFTIAFLDQMAEVLKENGQISVVSDDSDFFYAMRQIASDHAAFRFTHLDREWIEFSPNPKSRFQKFWEKKGVFPKRFIIERV